MEKRREKRYKTRQMAKVCGKLGVVNDISFEGMQISTALSPTSRNVDIIFETSGHFIKLLGVIRWIKRRQQLQSPNQIGVVIKQPPAEYITFIKTLGH